MIMICIKRAAVMEVDVSGVRESIFSNHMVAMNGNVPLQPLDFSFVTFP